LKIPLNLPLEKGEIKMKNFFNFPSFLKRGERGDFIYAKKVKQKNLLYIL